MSIDYKQHHNQNSPASGSEFNEPSQHLQVFKEVVDNSINPFAAGYQDGRITYWNHAFEELTGYSSQELREANWIDALVPAPLRGQVTALFERLSQAPAATSFNRKLLRKDGTVVPIKYTVHKARSSNAECQLYYSFVTNISREISLQEQTSAIQRLTSLSAMSAGIVHEIAQPLNSIKVLVDGMLYCYGKNHPIPSTEVFEKLEEISVELHRIDEIIRHMRSFVRISANPQLEPCNLNDSIIRTLKLLSRQLAAHDIKVDTNLYPQLPQIYADPKRLDEVIINLIANAMQELDKAGHKNREISCSTWPDKNCVVLEVSDNASGIEENILEHIFEPFVTTKSVRQGMGLGLSVVHTIVTRLGGQVYACNRDGGGATFMVKLPLLGSRQEGGIGDEPEYSSS